MNLPESAFVPYSPERLSEQEMRRRATEYLASIETRRSVRHFSADPVPRELIETAIQIASTAPSGAHRQPWTFVATSNAEVKHKIRMGAESEEFESYEGGRMSDEWLQALLPIGTNWEKPFLEIVPWIVVVFEETYRVEAGGGRSRNYYVKESVGIACGLFISAIHQMGLATLTHTPSPMSFLNDILGRPKHERPFILFPIGYPARNAEVPNLRRKTLDEVSVWIT